ncbi:MAG: hypothetical protein PHV93_03035 [Candidatus Pacebacteria bacterium]|nr:hypothetical protein [Candidatus Paceibacterota bacterium]
MKTYRNLFNNLSEKTPPQGLCLSIIKKVRSIQSRNAKIRFTLSSIVTLVSLGGIFESILKLIESSNQSGFSQYFSLIFSDSTLFFSYWKEFGLSLVESLPLVSLVFLLGIVVVFLWSGARALKDARRTFLPA